MSHVIIQTSKLLAVQQICGVIVCKQCKIGLPSERSAKDHLMSLHSTDPTIAKQTASKCDHAAQAVRAVPNPMREVYQHAPEPIPGSDQHNTFLRPLEGIDVSSGFKCTLCTSCYTSEKGFRTHLAAKHPTVVADTEWEQIALNGTVKLQTIFGGNKTRYFPVSSSVPFGRVLSAGSNSASPRPQPYSPSLCASGPLPSPLNVPALSSEPEDAIVNFFEEMDNALRTEQSPDGIPLPHVNPFLANTEFHLQLKDAGFDMAQAAEYSAMSGDLTDPEQLAVQDITAYFLRTRTIAQDISPAVLADVNMIGSGDFNVISDASAKKYARNFSRLVLCAFRVRHLPFMPREILEPLDQYLSTLQGHAQDTPSESRLDRLHDLIRVLCLGGLSKAESPKKLFVRHFLMFSSVIKNNRNQEDVYRWAQAKDITHLLAALLYGASSCALFQIYRLGLRVTTLRYRSSKVETRQQRKKLDEGIENVLSALDESQNSPAAYVRKTLTVARSISSSEDVSFIFDTCDKHQLCGVVDNVHISMKALGDIVREKQTQTESSFNTLLHGAAFPPNFFSHISALRDSLQDCQSGSSFLSQGHARQMAKQYTSWLFNSITRERPTGKAAFTPTDSDISSGNVIEVFGTKVKRTAVEQWLNTIQQVQQNLLVSSHLSSGSPGRASELETLKLFNTDYALRNFYISQGRVVLVTRYSKIRALSGVDKVIPRFPDPVTSRQFLTYLLMFRTLETAFVDALYGNTAMKGHLQSLFVERGVNYKAPRIRDLIRGDLRKHNLPIEFNDYRHYSAGIIPEVIEKSPRLQRSELVSEITAIAHLQAGHSATVAEFNYARKPTDLPSLTSSALAKYKLFSFEWHRCLGFVANESKVSGHVFPSHSPHTFPPHLPESLSNSITSTISKSIKQQLQVFGSQLSSTKRLQSPSHSDSIPKRPRYCSVLQPSPFAFEENLQSYLPALRTFIGNQTAMFRSETQLHSTVAIAKAVHNVLLIMPTGSGKTISILLPVYLEGPDSSTVIFVPLAALVSEIVDKCTQLNLSVATWSNRQTLAQVYVFSAQHPRRDIESFLRGLQNNGRLRRIVFDEAHLLVLWSIFRTSFRRLPYALQTGSHYVQFVLCTATLPPMYRDRLLDMLYLPSAVLYEQPTVRLNLKYEVVDTSDKACAQENGRFLTHEQIVLNELCDQVLSVCSVLLQQQGGRILVFCLYRKQVEQTRDHLASFLQDNLEVPVPVKAYHGAMNTQQLDECYEFWKRNETNVKIVVSTSAFGTGLDVPNVRAVFHTGGSNGLLEYAQETGRAGRDGKQALCVLIYNKALADRHTQYVEKSSAESSFSSEEEEDDRRQEWFLMQQYMSQTSSCRKNFIYRHVDGKGPGLCIFSNNSANCDICDALSNTPSPIIHPSPLVPRQPLLIQPSQSPASNQPSFMPVTTDGYPHNPPNRTTDSQQPFPAHSSIHPVSLLPPPTTTSPTSPPLPVVRRLQFESPPPPSTGAEDPLTDFRNAAHSLQNVCVACFVMEGTKKPSKHSCKSMKQRCRRCFHVGHSSKDCKTFNPRRKNFCYGCSLSQIRGENVHRQGEFGGSCYMRVARDLAWMLWASGLHGDQSFRSSLCSTTDSARLEQDTSISGDLNEFFHVWLNSNRDGVPNLVRLVLWWLSRQSTN